VDFEPTGEERYLSLDPGVSTGYATFKADGNVIRTGTLRKGKEELYPFLRLLALSKIEDFQNYLESTSVNPQLDIIVENYRLYPWKSMSQSWSSLETVRFIGAIDFWATLHEYPVHLQDPQVKGIAYKWAGLTVPKNHDMSHETDAFVHGVYFLQKNGIRKPQQGRGDA
jgi:hypothetical protein